MLYELLVGVLPFERPRPGPEGYDELRRLIRESDPPRPSARLSSIAEARRGIAAMRQTDPERLRRSLQGDLDWITMKALEKERTRRYPTVAAFASDIRRFLSDQPVDARPPSAAYRIRKFTRRHRGAVAAAVSLFVVLVGGLGVSRWQYLRAERARIDAESRGAALNLSDYRNYVVTIAAADAEVQASRFSEARERLLTAPAAMRGWEWDHLFLRAESTLLTLADRLPCSTANSGLWSTDTLVKDPDGKRIYFRHCQRVNRWDTETLAHSQSLSYPHVVVAAPSGRKVMKATTRGPERKWNVYVSDAFGVESPRLVGAVDSPPACADLSVDGRLLALGLESSTPPPRLTDVFEVWDTKTGRRISSVKLSNPPGADTRGIYGPMSCFVRLSPDTKLLATSGAVVGVWAAATGARLHVDPGQAGFLPQAIAFSPTARQLAIGRRNGLIDVLDFRSSNWTVRSLDGADVVRSRPLNERDRVQDVRNRRHEEVRAIAFAPDGRTVVSSQANRVIVWDLQSARAQKVLDAHQSPVTGLAVAGQLVYSSDADGTVKAQALQGASGITHLEASTPLVGPFAVSVDGGVVAQGSLSGSLTVWHPDERRRVLVPPAPGSSMGSGIGIAVVVPLADRRTILTGRGSLGTLMRWDSETQQAVSLPTMDRIEADCKAPRLDRAAVSPNDRYLAMVLGNCVVVRDLATARTLALRRLDKAGFPESSGSDVKFLSDESVLIAATHRFESPRSARIANSVMRWDWRTDLITADLFLPMPTRLPLTVAASRDGSRIALGEEEIVAVWDGALAREIGRIPIPRRSNSLAALSADGTRLAVPTLDQTSVGIWDTEKSQLLLRLTDDVPKFLAFTPNAQLIVVNGSGGLTIWETQRPKCPQCPNSPAPVK
jgi:WD40 repeat protein